ncbi:Transposable element Tc3 transposase [Folsomia candida]|uniref:Transposable element Tc3 transposase n=1 Tax=Folsomia candida TaxID=158441 RepID=A0A226D9B6_FOLCA|nr:Transposable element Tc3 transposase [Folsomia candida]
MSERINRRFTITELHKAGHRPCEIFNLLKHRGFKRSTVYGVIKRYSKAPSLADKKRSGGPRTARTKSMVKALRDRIRRNPRRQQKKLAIQLNVSPSTIKMALKSDLGVRAMRRGVCHMLTTKQKKNRVIRCRGLLKRHAGESYKNILFTDEKIFTVEEKFNRQNDRIYAKRKSDIPIAQRKSNRSHHLGSVMVWLGVSLVGKADLYFVPQGVKVREKNYLDEVLEPIVKPIGSTLFKNRDWTFQQDSAPAHGAKVVQRWLHDNVPGFISSQQWPSASPDLNPLDYGIWSKLEIMACSKSHTSVESLKQSLLKAWGDYPIESVRAAIDGWPSRLRSCVKAKGGNFEP